MRGELSDPTDTARLVRLAACCVLVVLFALAPLLYLDRDRAELTGDAGYDGLVAISRSLAGDARYDSSAEQARAKVTRRVLDDGRVVLSAPARDGGCWVLVVDAAAAAVPSRGTSADCLPVEQAGDVEQNSDAGAPVGQ